MDVTATSTISTAIEGLKKAQASVEESAEKIAGGSLDPDDIVSLSTAALSFKANAAVIKSENEATKSLLDITA
jgi:hypothetical protein